MAVWGKKPDFAPKSAKAQSGHNSLCPYCALKVRDLCRGWAEVEVEKMLKMSPKRGHVKDTLTMTKGSPEC